MTTITYLYAGILIALGLFSYFGLGTQSVTALIPAFFGLPILILGYIAAQKENLRKHMMHAIVGIALLGVLGTFSGLMKLFTIISGGEVERASAVYAQSIMFVASIAYMVFAVRSFIAARISA